MATTESKFGSPSVDTNRTDNVASGNTGAYLAASAAINSEVREAYNAAEITTTRRIAIFQADGVTPWSPLNFGERAISGSINVDSERDERRTFTLVLKNEDDLLDHDPSGFWYDKVLKFYRGIKYRNALGEVKRFELQIGEFMIDSIESGSYPSNINVSGRDYTKKLLLDKLVADTSFGAGQKVDDIVKVLATNGGITKFRLGAGGVTVGSNAAFTRKMSRWECIRKMCNALNIEVYFDREGFLVTRKYFDVSTSAPTVTLSNESTKSNIINFSKSSSDSRVFNHIVVTGTSEEETVSGYKYIAIRENNDVNSPTSIAKIGRRTQETEVSYLTSQTAANALAARLFSVASLEDFSISFSMRAVPWLEVGEILEFIDDTDSDSVPTRFLFTSFELSLAIGPLSGSGKRIVIVGTDTTPEGVDDTDE